MIDLQDFTIGYGSRRLLDRVSTTFAPGCLTALIGRNGSGKSTLLRALAGLNRNYSGRIVLDGTDIRYMPAGIMASKLAFVTSGRIRIPDMRCADVVAMGRAPYTDWIGRLKANDRMIVAEALRAVGMENYYERQMDTLSDGECQRIMIARALAQDTKVILLDEPTSFLDIPGRYELVSLLRSLAVDEGKCVVFSTHELDIAMRMCDSIALVDDGSLYHLTVDDMENSGHIDRLFKTCGQWSRSIGHENRHDG